MALPGWLCFLVREYFMLLCICCHARGPRHVREADASCFFRGWLQSAASPPSPSYPHEDLDPGQTGLGLSGSERAILGCGGPRRWGQGRVARESDHLTDCMWRLRGPHELGGCPSLQPQAQFYRPPHRDLTEWAWNEPVTQHPTHHPGIGAHSGRQTDRHSMGGLCTNCTPLVLVQLNRHGRHEQWGQSQGSWAGRTWVEGAGRVFLGGGGVLAGKRRKFWSDGG